VLNISAASQHDAFVHKSSWLRKNNLHFCMFFIWFSLLSSSKKHVIFIPENVINL